MVARRAATQKVPPKTTASTTEKNTLSKLTTDKSTMPFGVWFERKVR